MLENGKPEAKEFISQLDKVRVVGQCGCGCATIDFQIEGHPVPTGGMNLIGDFLFGPEDDPGGVFIFEQDGLLGGIEVLGYGEETITTLPDPTELRSV